MKRTTLYFVLTMCAGVAMLIMGVSTMVSQAAERRMAAMADSTFRPNALALALREAEAVEAQLRSERDSLRGTLTDTAGVAMAGVVVSDGYACTLTDSLGHYALRRREGARFVYYTVPDYCAVPTHADDDRTAAFYQAINDTDTIYNFTLTRLPGGKETRHQMIVIGDPQATNAINPYYTGPNDNPIEKSDVERFTDETMADIKRTIAEMPEGTPVYGLSMGDDVQYYGGYNDSLELRVRRALGSSAMTVFSVIGNHDQEGKRVYREKWEDNWGPTDYSFDRGDVHYVCLNNCDFYHGALYYSPGELSDRQMEWLAQDLQLADKHKKVVVSYHIPLTFGNRPGKGARPLDIESEPGHYSSSRLTTLLQLLDEFAGGYELFCGHTHFALNHEITHEGRQVMEHCHAAACGNIWQSNINICGTPNGYYVYTFDGTQMTDAYYKSTDWKRSRQMTLFRADTRFGEESYAADWDLPRNKQVLVANVFNADSRWRVVAMENGREYPMTRLSGVGQDAFSTGYHQRYSKAVSHWFVSKANTYLIMNHLYYYVPRSPRSVIFVKAIDPWGNTYTESSAHVVTQPYHNFAHYY